MPAQAGPRPRATPPSRRAPRVALWAAVAACAALTLAAAWSLRWGLALTGTPPLPLECSLFNAGLILTWRGTPPPLTPFPSTSPARRSVELTRFDNLSARSGTAWVRAALANVAWTPRYSEQTGLGGLRRSVTLPLWPAPLLGAALLVALRRTRRPPSACAACGYDRAGLANAGACPECGTAGAPA